MDIQRRINFYSKSAIAADNLAKCLTYIGLVFLIVSFIFYIKYAKNYQKSWKWKLLEFLLISCIAWNCSLSCLRCITYNFPFYFEKMDTKMRNFFSRINTDKLHNINVHLEYIKTPDGRRIIQLNKYYNLAVPD